MRTVGWMNSNGWESSELKWLECEKSRGLNEVTQIDERKCAEKPDTEVLVNGFGSMNESRGLNERDRLDESRRPSDQTRLFG